MSDTALKPALLSAVLITGSACPEGPRRPGEWRASKLVGVGVYNEANEKIGDNEITLDKSGKAAMHHRY